MILCIVLDHDGYCLVYIILCSHVSLTVWQACMFCFVLFCMFDGYYEQYERAQAVENSGASITMMGLYEVLKNIEQMLVPFKHYIEASEANMVQAPPTAQAPFVA